MTDPSQYFKGRTVQEQMNEVIGYVDVRSAEVATDAIAADVAQVHQDMLDADADATAAAASAAAAAGTLANAVKKTGEASQSIEGDILLTTGDLGVAGDLGVTGNLGVTGSATVPTPVNNTDAANKKYVDDADALKLNITDVNSYAVGLTGNQGPIAGTKTFGSTIEGSARNFISTNTTNAASAGLYRMIFKIKRTSFTGIRNHYVFWHFTRSRDRAPDILIIYTSNGSAAGLMVMRFNTEDYTYVISQDSDYIYLYMLTTASAADAFQCIFQMSTEGNGVLTNEATSADYATIEGTEVKRVTP